MPPAPTHPELSSFPTFGGRSGARPFPAEAMDYAERRSRLGILITRVGVATTVLLLVQVTDRFQRPGQAMQQTVARVQGDSDL
jgi:hypothetical protein